MPFKGVDVMDVKKEFVLKAMDVNVNFTELCRNFGISTNCGYKLIVFKMPRIKPFLPQTALPFFQQFVPFPKLLIRYYCFHPFFLSQL